MKFEKENEMITNSDFKNLENLIGYSLPEDYKEHMLKYNGGTSSDDELFIVAFNYDNEYREASYISFDPIKHGDDTVEIQFNLKQSYLFPKLLAIGSFLGGRILMGYRDHNYGNIYIDFSYQDPIKVANSFSEFVGRIEVEEI